MILSYYCGTCRLLNFIVLYTAKCVSNSYSIYILYVHTFYYIYRINVLCISVWDVNSPELKYGRNTSALALTKDLLSRINIVTKEKCIFSILAWA